MSRNPSAVAELLVIYDLTDCKKHNYQIITIILITDKAVIPLFYAKLKKVAINSRDAPIRHWAIIRRRLPINTKKLFCCLFKLFI